jgi:hypothetical protein
MNGIDLFCGAAPAPHYSPFSVPNRDPVTGYVSRSQSSGLNGDATLAGIPPYLLRRLQSVMNAAARLIYSSSRFDHITSLLSQLHWLKAKERIDYKLAVLVY